MSLTMHKNNLRERGYNQSELIAKEIVKIEGGINFEISTDALSKIIDTQRKMIEYQNKKMWQILIVIDDFADSPEFSRNSKLLHGLYTRGRHSQISTVVATQKFNALHPIIRVNASELFVFRLRNNQDLQTFIDEVSALIDKQTLLEMYKLATREAYSFLYIKLTAKDINDMFYIKFGQNKRLIN